MKIFIEENFEAIGKRAAQMIAGEMGLKPNLVLGLATGSTPLSTYQQLIQMHKEGLDFSRVVTFNLDEYYGLTPDNPQSYNYFMKENLFKHINIKPENINIPDGTVADVEKYCSKYDENIKNTGGIDLQVLGIGVNGHIGFNEPAEELAAGTHLTDLAEETIKANSRFFDSIDEVPKKAITMGIDSIMKAKKIMLLASGKNKAPIMDKLLKDGVISTQNPASLLLLHQDLTIIMDEEAATLYTK